MLIEHGVRHHEITEVVLLNVQQYDHVRKRCLDEHVYHIVHHHQQIVVEQE